ncbi:MAG: EamA family transporter [Lachnospiraceae bacterium]|nr:EamA family transporter [Lachnospiraceae bacterium]
MNTGKKARLQLVLSMTVFGTLAIFVRNIPLSSGELALYRAVFAALLIGVYLLISPDKLKLSAIKKELPLLLLSGAAMGINWILLFQAYQYTTVSVATLSYYFAPIIVTIVCPFLFHEKLTKKQIFCFVMSTVGVFLIIGIPDSGSVTGPAGKGTLGIFFGLGAACFYATVILLNKFIKTVAGIHRTFLQFLAAIAVLIPYVLFTGGFRFMTLEASGWINLLIVGLFHTGITYCLYFSSLKELPGQEAAILSYVDPLVAVIVSVTVLGENISILQILGGLLILGFALWNEKEGAAA